MDHNTERTPSQAPEILRSEFSARLNVLMREKAKSQKALSQLSGESASKINAYCKGKSLPSVTSAIAISEVLGVSVPFLILGKEITAPHTQSQNIEAESHFTVPLLDTKLAAGAGVDPLENQIGEVVIPDQIMEQLRRTSTRGLYMMQAEGDSMEPTVADGAYVLIDTEARKLTEAVFAFRYGETLRLKRLRRFGLADIEVLSDNPMYSREEIVGPDKEYFEVIGRAIWAGSLL